MKLCQYYVHVHVGLDSTVKNMVTSLRAVAELQNPAIRDRHWLQLMQATNVSQLHVHNSTTIVHVHCMCTAHVHVCYDEWFRKTSSCFFSLHNRLGSICLMKPILLIYWLLISITLKKRYLNMISHVFGNCIIFFV